MVPPIFTAVDSNLEINVSEIRQTVAEKATPALHKIDVRIAQTENTASLVTFNMRLAAAGIQVLLPDVDVVERENRRRRHSINSQLILATEGSEIRGGYLLNRRSMLLVGKMTSVGHWCAPVSEGLIQNQYAAVGVQLLIDASRRSPNLYCLGIGGRQESLTLLLEAAKWTIVEVPFYFRVVCAARFLREIVPLRNTSFRRALFDISAITGIGGVAIHAAQWFKSGKLRTTIQTDYLEEKTFGPWADVIWSDSRESYSLIADRSSACLNELYPAADSRFHRLRVVRDSETVGWAVVLATTMTRHKHFGNMRVGTIVDCLALPGEEVRVLAAATSQLHDLQADLVLTNQSHSAWQRACRIIGLLPGPSNYLFAASPRLAGSLAPFDERVHLVHMTRGDGDGPIHL